MLARRGIDGDIVTLKGRDVKLLRRLKQPPECVVRVLDAVLYLLQRKPGWASAQALMGDGREFPLALAKVREHLVNAETRELIAQLGLEKLREEVRKVSPALPVLLDWVAEMGIGMESEARREALYHDELEMEAQAALRKIPKAELKRLKQRAAEMRKAGVDAWTDEEIEKEGYSTYELGLAMLFM